MIWEQVDSYVNVTCGYRGEICKIIIMISIIRTTNSK